jgi:uncharacterized protein YjbI with pentapeptide repeats
MKSFTQQVESVKINQNEPIESKDYIAIKRDQITLQNTINSSVLQLISSLLFFITAYIAWRNLKESEKKQIAERFAKSVDQLGSDKLGVRVGAIFSLEKIARSYPEEHWVVMEVLTSYIRDQSLQGKSVFEPKTKEEDQPEESNIQTVLKKMDLESAISVTTDIQAALTVVCRRNNKQDPKDKVINLGFCDVRGSDLRNARLGNADLRGAKISGSDLRNARLGNADLRGAEISGANLEGVTLSGAKLQEANLSNAVLNNAKLRKAKLNNALLNYSCLINTDLQDADLTGVKFNSANLRQAKLNYSVLHFVCFVDAELQSTDMSHAKFKRTNLRNALIDDDTKLSKKMRLIHKINVNGACGEMLDNLDFSEAVLTNANFERASLKNTCFNGADLGGALFKDACLEGAAFLKTDIMSVLDTADFEGASLEGAVFQEATLKCTKFKGTDRTTNLSGITFCKVDLTSANFEKALLVKAKFVRSFLKDVNFNLADLSEARFDNCSYTEGTRFEQASLSKTVFVGPLRHADFRNSKHQEADFKGADTVSANF